jgi:hypothetical protein
MAPIVKSPMDNSPQSCHFADTFHGVLPSSISDLAKEVLELVQGLQQAHGYENGGESSALALTDY